MTKLGIIQPIKDPTDWVSSLVTVIKPNGKLCLCLDPKDLNKAIKKEHYKLPTTEEIFAEMQNPKFFTKLDALNGYWQIKIDKEISRLLTDPMDDFTTLVYLMEFTALVKCSKKR